MSIDQRDHETGTGSGRGPHIRLVIGLIVLVIIVAFAASNGQRVEIDYLVGSSDWRLIWVILGSAVLGALGTLLIQRRRRARA